MSHDVCPDDTAVNAVAWLQQRWCRNAHISKPNQNLSLQGWSDSSSGDRDSSFTVILGDSFLWKCALIMGMRLDVRGGETSDSSVWRQEVLAGRSLWSTHCFVAAVYTSSESERTDSILAENKDPLSVASPEECSIFHDPINKLLKSNR